MNEKLIKIYIQGSDNLNNQNTFIINSLSDHIFPTLE